MAASPRKKKSTRASVRNAHCPGGQRGPGARSYKNKKPWARFVQYAQRRCYCIDPEGGYAGRKLNGIRCNLTEAGLKIIWARDEASKFKKPSLVRIDADGDYRIGNVEFVEAYKRESEFT